MYIGFLLLSLIPVFTSGDLERSIHFFLYYTAIGFFALYAYNHRNDIETGLPKLVFILSGVYIAVWLVLIFGSTVFPIPQTGLQFVYSKFTSHNHLGDFLMLPILGCLYYFFQQGKKNALLLLCILLPILVLSYSRSAYVAVGVTSIYMFFQFSQKSAKRFLYQKVIIAFVIASLCLFFIATVTEVRHVPFFGTIHQYLSQNFDLKEKYFLAKRPQYLQQTLSGFSDQYLFGVGPGNFIHVSLKQAKIPDSWARSETTHTIFLDLLVENGMFSLLLFLLFLFFVVREADKKSIYFFFFVALLLNFQTDYTYRIYSFFLLFFVFIGLLARDERSRMKNPVGLCLVIALLVMMAYASTFLLFTKQYTSAFLINPLNKSVYMPLVAEKMREKNYQEAASLLTFYNRFFAADPVVLNNIGRTYEKMGNTKTAIVYYQKAFTADKFMNHNLIYRIYILLLLEYGQKTADAYFTSTLAKHFPPSVEKHLPYVYRRNLQILCLHMEDKSSCASERILY